MFLKELLIILISALPVSELRGGIPLALFIFKFAPLKAYLFGVFGNFLPVIPLLLFWHFLADRLVKKFHFVHRCRKWWFGRVRNNHAHKFEIFKELALFIFVAIPLPFTGAWSGTVAAFLFGVPFWRAVLAIAAGILAAGFIVLGGLGMLMF